MNYLELHFSGGGAGGHTELTDVRTHGSSNGQVLHAVRGCYTLHETQSTFMWTNAVKAFSVLALRHRAYLASLSANERNPVAILRGDRGSLAASLDYCISKSPGWISDMFGFDRHGVPFAKRLFRRHNSELKKPGPVTISFSPSFVKDGQIRVFVEALEVSDAEVLLHWA